MKIYDDNIVTKEDIELLQSNIDQLKENTKERFDDQRNYLKTNRLISIFMLPVVVIFVLLIIMIFHSNEEIHDSAQEAISSVFESHVTETKE